MNGLTRFFLVLLRLAIGWHFLFEGVEKIHSVNTGPTTSQQPWSSKVYLEEATGPLAEFFHRQAGDTDEQVLALLEVQPVKPGEDPGRVPPHQRISPALDQAWKQYFQRFRQHYQDQLGEEQLKLLDVKFIQAENQAVVWLLGCNGAREVERAFGSSAAVKIKETPAERIGAYRQKVRELRQIMEEKLPAFGRDVEKRNLGKLKAEVRQQRTELLADLQKLIVDALSSVLTAEQKVERGPVPPLAHDSPLKWTHLDWLDAITRYGLTTVGVCLLLGLFTRSACIGGTLFLLMFYLAMPALPWLPEPARAEGHYLFVNKNIIEMLALLVLATTRSGRWAGLDGLLYCLMPWRWRTQAPSPSPEATPVPLVR
jgi:uncharacterized membrane protein YphA (DoxX/SURF4 family)